MTHWFKNTLDYKMGFMIIIGGIVGTILGHTFTFKETGKLSLIISLSYMYLLAIIGTLMLIEGAKELIEQEKLIFKQKLHTLLDTWSAIKLRFPKSDSMKVLLHQLFLGL